MNIKFASALLAVAAITLAGCAAQPSSDEQTPPATGTAPTIETAPGAEAEAVWLDGGRMIGIVTWGSSSCIPFVGDASASGQEITVSLSDTIEGQDQRPCTADLVARASVLGTPEGIDPHEDVTLKVSYLDRQLSIALDDEDDLLAAPGSPTDYLPSAAWTEDGRSIVLLTWGSSSCPPVVESIEESDTEVIATFKTQEGPCTMDMAPRATILGLSHKNDDRTLKLVGDNLDATIQVIG